MNEFFETDMFLSTLDLYAVHVLASGTVNQEFLRLPENIAHEALPPEAIPEFSAPLAIMAMSLLAVALARVGYAGSPGSLSRLP